jgi:hypothetical protein
MQYSSKTLEQEKEYYAIIKRLRESEHGPFLGRVADIINNRTSALLTHISIMIAILSVILTQFGDFKKVDLFTELVTLEIVSYLIFSIGCLQALFIINPTTFFRYKEQISDYWCIILRRRRRIYLASLTGTIVVTVAFLITLLERVFFRIG